MGGMCMHVSLYNNKQQSTYCGCLRCCSWKCSTRPEPHNASAPGLCGFQTVWGHCGYVAGCLCQVCSYYMLWSDHAQRLVCGALPPATALTLAWAFGSNVYITKGMEQLSQAYLQKLHCCHSWECHLRKALSFGLAGPTSTYL